jgi:hypothetical protein
MGNSTKSNAIPSLWDLSKEVSKIIGERLASLQELLEKDLMDLQDLLKDNFVGFQDIF